jgi:hypothetical protein
MITDEHRTRLPARLGAPARRALDAAGISGLDDLANWSRDELLGLHGMGPKAMRTLADALDTNGLSLRDDC